MEVNDYALRQLLHALPAANVAFLKRLLTFLRRVAAYSSKNHMVAESLATFFGMVPHDVRPNLWMRRAINLTFVVQGRP